MTHFLLSGQGNSKMGAHYLPLMLEGSARSWLNNSSANNIHNWLDFEEAFRKNFEGIYKRPSNAESLSNHRRDVGSSGSTYVKLFNMPTPL
jgi:hypothetical protein